MTTQGELKILSRREFIKEAVGALAAFCIGGMSLQCRAQPEKIYNDDEIWSTSSNHIRLRLYLLNTGNLQIDYDLMIKDVKVGEKVWIPVPAYLIVHPQGMVLFDTGLHPLIATNPEQRLGKGANAIGYNMAQGQDIVSQLKKLGYSPDNINYVICSHLHFDHAGCIHFFSKSKLLVQKKELKYARSRDQSDFSYCRSDFDSPIKFDTIEGDYDVFGDKTVVSLYTPGHTPGHQSLLVKLESGPVVLTADACYVAQNYLELKLPRAVENSDEAMKSIMRIKRYKEEHGAMVIPGHDPEFWNGLKKAPDFYE